MDVKEAVGVAKQYVHDLFGEEKIVNLGLEEVIFDEKAKSWLITVGFSRPWDAAPNLGGLLPPGEPKRSYKVVRIADADHKVLSVKERTLLSVPAT
jgi:hypothetical protein